MPSALKTRAPPPCVAARPIAASPTQNLGPRWRTLGTAGSLPESANVSYGTWAWANRGALGGPICDSRVRCQERESCCLRLEAFLAWYSAIPLVGGVRLSRGCADHDK